MFRECSRLRLNWHSIAGLVGITSATNNENTLQICPLHPRSLTPTLKITYEPDSRRGWACCSDPQCRFDGDILTLVALALNTDTLDVNRGLSREGKFEHLIDKDHSLTPFLHGWLAHNEEPTLLMRDYVSRAQLALRKQPELCQLRTGMVRNALQLIPSEIGVVTGPAPHAMPTLDAVMYRKHPHLLYPFMFDREVASVWIQPADQPRAIPTPVQMESCISGGLFMEGNAKDAKTLFAMTNPAAAARLYSALKISGLTKIPVVGITALPLPKSAASVTRICFVETNDVPLNLESALRIHSSRYACANSLTESDCQLDLHVCPTNCTLDDLAAERLSAYAANSKMYMPLETWCVRRLDELLKSQGQDAVRGVLAVADVLIAGRLVLKAAADKLNLPRELQDVLAVRTTEALREARITLGNGNVVQNTTDGILAVFTAVRSRISSYSGRTTLANFGLTVVRKVYTQDGLIRVCRISPADTGAPTVTVALHDADLRSAEALKRAITRAYAEAGESTYIACYDRKGYGWYDIVDKLGEGLKPEHEIEALGFDGKQTHFANAVVSPEAVQAQTVLYALPANIRSAYAGPPADSPVTDDDAATVYRDLLQSDEPYAMAVAAGLLHIAQCCVRAPGVPQHLLFPEDTPGAWQPAIQQLHRIMSGRLALDKYAGNLKEALDACKGLGSLPWIGHIFDTHETRIAQALSASGVSAVASLDSITAELIAQPTGVSFFASTERLDGRQPLPEGRVIELQRCFPRFLKSVYATLQSPAAYASPVAVCGAYLGVCAQFGVEPNPLFVASLKTYHSTTASNLTVFFNVLHRVYTEGLGNCALKIAHGPPDDKTKAAVYMLDDLVAVDKDIINILKRRTRGCRFTETSISAELQGTGCLIPAPADTPAALMRGYWFLSRDTWNTHVVRPPLQLAKPVQPVCAVL